MPAQPGEQLNIAAARLGITTAALRMRVRRGLVPAFKLDGRWYVGSPSEQGAQETAHESEQAAQNSTLLEHLQAEVVYLRARLEEALALAAREQELRRGEQPPQLAAPVDTNLVRAPEMPATQDTATPSSTSAPLPGRAAWWRRWTGRR